MNRQKLLLVEDDETIALGLSYALEKQFDVKVCRNVMTALEEIKGIEYDIALIDITLPDGAGYEVCKAIKEKWNTGIIFLTARDDEASVVMGLDIGADDYVTKPFRLRELMSRINSVLRRRGVKDTVDNIKKYGNVVVDLNRGAVYKNGKEVFLTAQEYKLLLKLITNEGMVMTRNNLLESIWDISGDFVNDNTLTVYIKRLREKIEDDPQNPQIIKTVRGRGYIIE